MNPEDIKLKQVLVPIEHDVLSSETGSARFRTSDQTLYFREGLSRVIHRVVPKVRGKSQRRDDKRQRMIARRGK